MTDNTQSDTDNEQNEETITMTVTRYDRPDVADIDEGDHISAVGEVEEIREANEDELPEDVYDADYIVEGTGGRTRYVETSSVGNDRWRRADGMNVTGTNERSRRVEVTRSLEHFPDEHNPEDSVEEIKGIGPKTAGEMGVSTLAELYVKMLEPNDHHVTQHLNYGLQNRVEDVLGLEYNGIDEVEEFGNYRPETAEPAEEENEENGDDDDLADDENVVDDDENDEKDAEPADDENGDDDDENDYEHPVPADVIDDAATKHHVYAEDVAAVIADDLHPQSHTRELLDCDDVNANYRDDGYAVVTVREGCPDWMYDCAREHSDADLGDEYCKDVIRAVRTAYRQMDCNNYDFADGTYSAGYAQVVPIEDEDEDDSLSENDKREIEQVVDEADDLLGALARSVSTDERDELHAVLQLFSGQTDYDEVAWEEDYEPEIEPVILQKYVQYAREIEVEVPEEAEEVLAGSDQDPDLLRIIADAHARIHLRNHVTTDDSWKAHQMVPLVTDDDDDDEPTREDDPVEQIEEVFAELDECPAVRGFYDDLPSPSTHVEHYGIHITLHDRDGRAVAIVDYVGGMGVADTAFSGKIEDVHGAIVELVQETGATVHRDEFDVLDGG